MFSPSWEGGIYVRWWICQHDGETSFTICTYIRSSLSLNILQLCQLYLDKAGTKIFYEDGNFIYCFKPTFYNTAWHMVEISIPFTFKLYFLIISRGSALNFLLFCLHFWQLYFFLRFLFCCVYHFLALSSLLK